MASLRAFVEPDIPAVVDLYRRTFAGGSIRDAAGLCRYVADVFFHNPFRDARLPSLVYEENQTILGFLGVIPYRMMMNDQPIRMAVSTQFMVDARSHNTLAALELVKAFLAGPQDLSLADGASGLSRKIWEAVGGYSVPLYAFRWTRPLRRCEQLLESTEEQFPWRTVTVPVIRPLCRALDAAFYRKNVAASTAAPLSREPLEAETILRTLPRVARRDQFKPHYDAASLRWILDLAAQKKKVGTLRGSALREHSGEVVGWYLYYLNPGRTAHVLQFAVLPHLISAVLPDFFSQLRGEGATAVSGRLEPKFLHEFFHHGCTYTMGSAFLVHSKHGDILQAIYTGNAFLSRLEGEWWNCFSEFAS